MKCKVYCQTSSEHSADHFYPGYICNIVETRDILLLPLSIFPLQRLQLGPTHLETILCVCVSQCECVNACGYMCKYVCLVMTSRI